MKISNLLKRGRYFRILLIILFIAVIAEYLWTLISGYENTEEMKIMQLIIAIRIVLIVIFCLIPIINLLKRGVFSKKACFAFIKTSEKLSYGSAVKLSLYFIIFITFLCEWIIESRLDYSATVVVMATLGIVSAIKTKRKDSF